MKCAICDRMAGEEGYCELHTKACKSVNEKYHEWKKALEISWKEYLSKIIKNSLTGEWAREAAEYLVKSGETRSVKQG